MRMEVHIYHHTHPIAVTTATTCSCRERSVGSSPTMPRSIALAQVMRALDPLFLWREERRGAAVPVRVAEYLTLLYMLLLCASDAPTSHQAGVRSVVRFPVGSARSRDACALWPPVLVM
jgi:hypothetical protein